ncbi:MarR family winged helix-turn-helix transcriptional regulator [Sediminicola luteus]|uniref:HTH marR-type domain-containing protein n=1 Tax=Sediminicola luteus TaxID=319238 RepID=A0A2A4G8Z5_9FLAO|nr:MarR family transcriptional regulator [Sediminicola luteus]PCE64242.1 hypothetical protein B7P33_08035 [Sediminicola luteus]
MELERGAYPLAYFSFLGVSERLSRNIKMALKPFGITHAQLNVLHLLYEAAPQTLCARELKSKMVVQQPDLTRMMDRLVDKGLVDRAENAENRRMLSIGLTAKGVNTFEAAYKEAKNSVGHFFSDFLSKEEAVQLTRILDKLKL